MRLKREAVELGTTLTELIETTLREGLARKRMKPSLVRDVEIPTYGSGGTLPGVDLDDSSSLLDIMESDSDPH